MNDYNISNYEKYLIKNKKDTKSDDLFQCIQEYSSIKNNSKVNFNNIKILDMELLEGDMFFNEVDLILSYQENQQLKYIHFEFKKIMYYDIGGNFNHCEKIDIERLKEGFRINFINKRKNKKCMISDFLEIEAKELIIKGINKNEFLEIKSKYPLNLVKLTKQEVMYDLIYKFKQYFNTSYEKAYEIYNTSYKLNGLGTIIYDGNLKKINELNLSQNKKVFLNKILDLFLYSLIYDFGKTYKESEFYICVRPEGGNYQILQIKFINLQSVQFDVTDIFEIRHDNKIQNIYINLNNENLFELVLNVDDGFIKIKFEDVIIECLKPYGGAQKGLLVY